MVILLHTRHDVTSNDNYIEYVAEEIYTLFFKNENNSEINKRLQIINMGSQGYYGEKYKISVALIGSWLNSETKGKL